MEQTEQTKETELNFFDDLKIGLSKTFIEILNKYHIELKEDCSLDIGLEDDYNTILGQLEAHLKAVIKNYGLNNKKEDLEND